ncbi:hypothetical protein LCGC14_2756950 [marine sediment metagenome]|uniref:HNH nuclease domain-containing protein n=1 Tax=marine sediment metagenome TaxID=412755 RepID=A0A0F8Z012_9ZZZZ
MDNYYGVGAMKKSKIPKISKKQKKVKGWERMIIARLIMKCKGYCMKCGKWPDFKDGRGQLHLSHTIPKSRGGQATEENCQMLCRVCHNARHGIIEK